jgi:hypothetical protein
VSEQDDIGIRGESLVISRLTELFPSGRGRRAAYFRPVFLGDKFPTLDLLVQLRRVGKQLLFFTAQVKATADIPAQPSSRLPLRVSKEDVGRMLASATPAYLFAADVINDRVYLSAVDEAMRGGVSSLPRSHELTRPNLRLLWSEVRAYWKQVRRPKARTAFPYS